MSGSPIDNIARRKKPFRKGSIKESPYLKTSFATAQILVSGRKRIDEYCWLRRRVLSCRIEKSKLLIEYKGEETFRTPASNVFIEIIRDLIVRKNVRSSSWIWNPFENYIRTSSCLLRIFRI